MKHTQGEWHPVELCGFWCVQDEPFYEGKDLLDAEKVGEDQAEANAKLMAAAPDMLSTLTTIVTFLKNNGFAAHKVYKNYVEQAQAAIKKATE